MTKPEEVVASVDRVVVAASALGVVALALLVLVPLWAPLVFAVWTAVLLHSFTGKLARLVRCRAIAAAVATALVALLLVPLGVLLVSLVMSVSALVRELLASAKMRQAIEVLLSSDPNGGDRPLGVARWVELAQAHGAMALRAGQRFAGAGAWALLVLLVFFVTLYQCLAQGGVMWAWIKEHLPLRSQTTSRLAAAFVETGRGLIVGAGLTSLLQATVATMLFAALGVPRAIVLGAMTFVASIIPVVGTSAVWLPVAIGLGLRGDYARATILLLVGALGIGTVDNVTRPIFQKWGGKLDLPAFLLFLAAFGGLKAFGPAGLALGPLTLRMAREVLAIARERRTALASRT
jgi:predicted PurR-regulated permease PerM